MFCKLPTLLSEDRLANIVRYSNYAKDFQGAILEAGVYKGGSLELLANLNKNTDVFGVDSFSGIPATTEHDFHHEGDFNDVDPIAIVGYFKMIHPHVRILKGFVPEVFDFFDDNIRFKFSHIDVDVYKSVKDCLEFVFPRTVTGGVILLDDYGFRSTKGCRKAVDDFVSNPAVKLTHHEELKYFKSESSSSHGQYLIIK